MDAVIDNLVRRVMGEAARRRRVPVERLSFIDAVRWLAEATRRVVELKLRRAPDRPGRLEPRAAKRRPKDYDRLNQPREILRHREAAKSDKA